VTVEFVGRLESESRRKVGQHGSGGAGVVQSIVRTSGIDTELRAQCRQLVAGLTSFPELPRQVESAQRSLVFEGDACAGRRRPKEPEVERCVVGDEDAATGQ